MSRNISLETFLSIVQALEISLSDFFIPYSITHDTEMTELLLKIQNYPQHSEIVQKVIEILELSQKTKKHLNGAFYLPAELINLEICTLICLPLSEV